MDALMTLKDLQGVTRAFDDFATIEDCDIPEYYKTIFPKKCKCGGEMIMTKYGRTQLQCCNQNCWVKMAHRLNYFISYLGFKNFGEQACLSLFALNHDVLPYRSFLAAFLLSDTQVLNAVGDARMNIFRDIQQELHESTYTFVDAISALGIPNVGSRSVLFDIVKSPEVFAMCMVQHKTDELCDLAGIQALSTKFYLSCFDIDTVLLMQDIMPHIAATPRGEMFVAITGKVYVQGTYYTRSEFIRLCESIRGSDGTQLYRLVETKARDKLQYVIADEPSTSDKYQIGLSLGKLITAEEFYNLLVQEANLEKESARTTSEGGNTDGT